MSIIQELNAKMPSRLNVDDPYYRAIFGKVDFIPEPVISTSADYRCGAVANEFEYVKGYMDYLTQARGVDDYSGGDLELVINKFVRLSRFDGETDDQLRNRFYAQVRRRNNPRWVTPWSILDVFSYYFDANSIHIIENPPTVNQALNPIFETGVLTPWTATQSGDSTAAISAAARYIQGYGVSMVKGASGQAYISQVISSMNGACRMVLMLAGTCTLKATLQRSSDSKYWNEDTLAWQAGATGKTFTSTSGKFNPFELDMILSSPTNVTVTLEVMSGSGYLGRVEFGSYDGQPTLRTEVVSGGQSSAFMSLWPAGADPVGGTNYAYGGFLDQAFIGGTGIGIGSDVFDELLQRLKPAGVQGTFVLLDRAV